jgi:hypothetical protein
MSSIVETTYFSAEYRQRRRSGPCCFLRQKRTYGLMTICSRMAILWVTGMANMSTRAIIIQAQQAAYDEMRWRFEAMGGDGWYCQRQKDYAFGLIDEYGLRATARILHMPRRTLQRWCRRRCKYVRRCPDWVYSWAAKRRKRREFWARRGYF